MTAPGPFDPFSSIKLGPLPWRDRFVTAASFEELTRNTTVTDRLVKFRTEPTEFTERAAAILK
jgi:hypothetical protein